MLAAQQSAPDAPIPFNFESHSVRVITDDNGDAWFVAGDVCAALTLGVEQTRRLDEDEKGLRIVQTPGGPQEVVVINESGLYSFILTSRKPEAKRFKRWVTHEVLPAIRKTGSYAATAKPAELSRMDLIEMAMAAERERIAADAKVQELEHQVAEQAPAVEGFNLLADASGSLCFRDAAANLKMRQCDLMDYLVSKKWIYERVGSEGYKAYGDRLQTLDLRYNSFPYESKTTGEPKTRRQVRITNKGLTKLAAMIAQDAVAKRLAAGAGQNQQRLPLPEDDG